MHTYKPAKRRLAGHANVNSTAVETRRCELEETSNKHRWVLRNRIVNGAPHETGKRPAARQTWGYKRSKR
eukprot:1775583-Lingulodinium_polyedra.AAC.1